MDAKQDDAGLFERCPPLQGDLPEILIERQYESRLGFGKL
jgi:hypothetical protein